MGTSRWYVADAATLDKMLSDAPDVCVIAPLGGVPVSCADVRAQARTAHEARRELVCDVSQTGPSACPALGMGADVALVRALASGRVLVGIGGHAALASCLDEALEPLGADEATCALADADARVRWRARSDAAQVVASYLACHPLMAEVRYLGLRADPSFSVAARTLQGGFGPIVDWRARCDKDAWRRFSADARDPRDQVLELEALLGGR